MDFSTVHHFADDTNLLLTENSLKRLNKHINRDLKFVVQWILANKQISIYRKNKDCHFKSRNRKISKHLNFRISGQKIVTVDSVKYLGLTLQSDLHWKMHLTSLEKKLSKSIGLLPKFLLKTIIYSIFNSHLIDGCEVWSQNQNNVLVHRLQKLQEKAVCLIDFETNTNVVGRLLKDSNILKLTDFIKYKYALFIRNSLRKENIPIFNEFYTLFNQSHVYNTRGSTSQMLIVPQIQTNHYGEHFFKSRSINAWNLYQRNLKTGLITCDFAKFKKLIFQFHLNQYQLRVR